MAQLNGNQMMNLNGMNGHNDHNGHNGYNGYTTASNSSVSNIHSPLYNAEPWPYNETQSDEKKQAEEVDLDNGCNEALIKSEQSPLSSDEIYNIEYSSKYKETMDFKNTLKTFNKYYQINVNYAQVEDKNPQYKSALMHFFQRFRCFINQYWLC